jgi:hypothetical protein
MLRPSDPARRSRNDHPGSQLLPPHTHPQAFYDHSMQELLHQCFTSLAAGDPSHRAADLRLTRQDCRLGFNLAAGEVLSRQLLAAELDQAVEDGASPEEIEAMVGGGAGRCGARRGWARPGCHLPCCHPGSGGVRSTHPGPRLQVRALQREQEEARQLQEQRAQQQQGGGSRPSTPPRGPAGSRPASPLRRSMSLFGGSSRPSTPGSTTRPGTDAPGQPAGDGASDTSSSSSSSPELLVPLRQVSLFLREAGLVPRVLSKLVTDQFHVSPLPGGARTLWHPLLLGAAWRALGRPRCCCFSAAWPAGATLPPPPNPPAG